MTLDQSFMLRLREALAASWTLETAYEGAQQPGNPALGQCYPTARVVQHYYPQTEVTKGTVRTAERSELHFWNGLRLGDELFHIDLSWQQFSPGAIVTDFVVLDRNDLGDRDATIERCALLLRRVEAYLAREVTHA